MRDLGRWLLAICVIGSCIGASGDAAANCYDPASASEEPPSHMMGLDMDELDWVAYFNNTGLFPIFENWNSFEIGAILRFDGADNVWRKAGKCIAVKQRDIEPGSDRDFRVKIFTHGAGSEEECGSGCSFFLASIPKWKSEETTSDIVKASLRKEKNIRYFTDCSALQYTLLKEENLWKGRCYKDLENKLVVVGEVITGSKEGYPFGVKEIGSTFRMGRRFSETDKDRILESLRNAKGVNIDKERPIAFRPLFGAEIDGGVVAAMADIMRDFERIATNRRNDDRP